jgi:hypothetical protein
LQHAVKSRVEVAVAGEKLGAHHERDRGQGVDLLLC